MKSRPVLIIGAVNEGASIRATLEAAAAAVNARVVEGKLRIPYGLWPVEVVNEEGKPEKVVQRLNKDVAVRLVAAFNSLRGRLARFVGDGVAIYQRHPDYTRASDAAAWQRYGKVVSAEAGDTELVLQGELTDAGKALLAANETLAPSPHWGLARTADKLEGLAVMEPVALYSVGLTPRPNIAGAAVNEEMHAGAATEPPPAEALAAAAERDRELALLAAQIAALEAAMQSTTATATVRLQELANRDEQIRALGADVERLRGELDAARKQFDVVNANAAQMTQAAECAANERKALLGALLSAAVGAGLILEADKAAWLENLGKGPAAINELLAPERVLKTRSVVDPARIAGANEAQGGVSAAARFETAVRTRMAATKEDWATAWNRTREAHGELYRLMRDGGKA